jgi:hypothetical protein
MRHRACFRLFSVAFLAFLCPGFGEPAFRDVVELGGGCELTELCVGVGTGLNQARPGAWVPLRFVVRNNSSEMFKTSVRVAAPAGFGTENEARYTSQQNFSLDLPPGSERSYECILRVPPLATEDTRHMQFRNQYEVDFQAGTGLGAIHIPVEARFLNAGELHVLEVRRRTGIYALGLRDPGVGPEGLQSSVPENDDARKWVLPGSWQVISGVVEGLPRHWMGYSSVDCVLWDDGAAGDLSVSQREALRRFVRLGGHLVIFSGKDWQLLNDPLFEPMLPLERLRSVKMAVPKESLEGVIGSRPESWAASKEGRPESWTTRKDGLLDVSLCQGEIRPPAKTICTALDHARKPPAPVPVAWQWPHGAGTVTLLAFSASDPLGRLASARSLLWRRALARSRMFVSSDDGFEWRRQVEGVLRSGQAQTMQPRGWVGRFLFLYVLALVPVNYVAFRLLERVNFAWVAGLFIAAGFGVYAYQHDTLSSGAANVRLLNVVCLKPGGDLAEVKSFLALFSPTSRTYGLAVEGEEFLFSALETEPLFATGSRRGPEILGGITQRRLNIEGPGPQVVAKLDVPARSMAILQLQGLVKLGPEELESLNSTRATPPEVLVSKMPRELAPVIRQDMVLLDCRAGPFLRLSIDGRAVTPGQETTFYYCSTKP